MRRAIFVRAVFVCVLVGGTVGCGGKAQRQKNDLKQIVISYHIMADEGRPPANEQEFADRSGMDINLVKQYVVHWGINLRDVPDMTKTVCAYAPDVPTKGGLVATFDSMVHKVTAEEFANLPKPTAVKMTDRKPDVTLTDEEFQKSFHNHDNKVVELTGVIVGFESSSEQSTPTHIHEAILLGKNRLVPTAYCVAAEPQPWAKYAIGQKVTIVGRRQNFGFGSALPRLLECVVVKAEPHRGVTTTAEAMAKEFAASAAAATEKFEGKSLIVTGKIVSVKPDRFSYALELQGQDKRSNAADLRDKAVSNRPD